MIVPILSKKELAGLWNMIGHKGRVKGHQFRKLFTENVLKQLGVNRAEFQRIRQFDFEQSRKLVQIFDLDEDDLSLISGAKKSHS